VVGGGVRRTARLRLGHERGRIDSGVIVEHPGKEYAEALLRGFEDRLGAGGGDGVADDGVEVVLGEGDEVLDIEGGDEVEGFAELVVGVLDAGEFLVGAAELAAAQGELIAGLAVSEDPRTQWGQHDLLLRGKKLWTIALVRGDGQSYPMELV